MDEYAFLEEERNMSTDKFLESEEKKPRKKILINKKLKTMDLFLYLCSKYSCTLGDIVSSDEKNKYLFNSTQLANELNRIYNQGMDFSKIEHRTVKTHLLEIYDLTHDSNGPKPLMGVCLECYVQSRYGDEFRKADPYDIENKTIYFALTKVLSANDYEILKASVYSNQYLDVASQKRIYNALSVMKNPKAKYADGNVFKDMLLDAEATINDKVSLLVEAIQEDAKVRFTYCKYQFEDNAIKLKDYHAGNEENETRKFSPYSVFSHGGMFYLLAKEDDKVNKEDKKGNDPIAHHYRVDRIKNLEMVPGTETMYGHEKRDDAPLKLWQKYIDRGSGIFDVHKYLKNHPMMLNAYAKDMLTVKLSVAKSLLNVMVDFFADDLNKDHVMEDPKDNSRVIITVYASDLGIKNICKQYGSDAVLLPATEDTDEKDKEGIDRLREELRDELEKAKAFY